MAKETDDKIISAKVTKVREVITNVSKHDIVLALHSNDLDVQKTIQALMEGDALDEWVRPSGKDKKKNKKPAAAAAPAPTPVIVPSVPLTSVKKAAPAPVPTPAPVANGVNGTQKKRTETQSSVTSNGVSSSSSVDGAVAESARRSAQWTAEVKQGKDAIQNVFKSIHDVLRERERALLNELQKQDQASTKLFAANRTNLESARKKAEAGGDISGDLKAISKAETDLLSSETFSYDMTKLVAQINAFGRVFSAPGAPAAVPVPHVAAYSPPAAPAANKSGSHSSLVSAGADDSGLGASPVPPPAKVVSNAGPIQVASTGLSAQQLADIQKQVQERLAASGISADVIKGLESGVVRRPRKEGGPERGGPKGAQGGRGGKANGATRGGKGPKLSILE